MATHDYVIDNSTGANVRADINNVLQAILTNNSSSSAPSTTAAYMWWADTTSGTLKIRNSSDNAWVELLQLDGTLTLEDGSASTPALAFRDDLNTGIFSSAADTFNVATAGVERMELGATTIFNEDGADVDFRIEGDTDAALFFVNAGLDQIGIGTDSPQNRMHMHKGDSDKCVLQFTNSTTGLASGDGLQIGLSSSEEGLINMKETAAIVFKTTDTERMRIDSAGEVLIGRSNTSGIASSANDLVVSKSGNMGITIQSTDSSYSNLFYADSAGSSQGFVSYQHSTDSLQIATVGSERMRIDNAGNVGIGTTSPSRKLEITDATFSALRIKNSSTSIANGTNIAGIEFEHADSSAAGVCAGINALMADTSTGGLHMTFSTGTNVNLYQENMRLDSSGNLGIGTTSPDSKLHVANDNSFAAKFGGSGGGSSYFIEIGQLGTSSSAGFNATGSSGAMLFRLNGSEKMRIATNGFVGIGTSSPQTQLDVFKTGNVVTGRFGCDTASAVCCDFKNTISSGTAFFARFIYTGSECGSITASSTGSTAYNTSSDYRLKENEVEISDGITRLKTLKPYRFNWKAHPDLTVDGFFAHEVTAVPEAITGTKDEVATEDNNGLGYKKGDPIYQSIDQSKLVPLITAALKEAIGKIEVLETKVAALEAA